MAVHHEDAEKIRGEIIRVAEGKQGYLGEQEAVPVEGRGLVFDELQPDAGGGDRQRGEDAEWDSEGGADGVRVPGEVLREGDDGQGRADVGRVRHHGRGAVEPGGAVHEHEGDHEVRAGVLLVHLREGQEEALSLLDHAVLLLVGLLPAILQEDVPGVRGGAVPGVEGYHRGVHRGDVEPREAGTWLSRIL